MNLLIAGSRGFEESLALSQIRELIKNPKIIKVVIHGGAVGVDRAGDAWAAERALPVVVFHPPFDQLGKRAGPIRNEMMVRACDAALVLWDGTSAGTKSTIDFLERHRKRYKLCVIN